MPEAQHPPVVPVSQEIPFASPPAVYERLRGPHTFLLESAGELSAISRYSFIGIDPYLVLSAKNGLVEIDFGGRRTVSSRNPLARLRELVTAYRQQIIPGLPPFQGGAAGMFSYDFVRYLEKLPETARDDLNIPDAHFAMFDRVVAFDHALQKAWIIVCPGARETVLGFSEPGPQDRQSAEAVIKEIQRRICEERPQSCAPLSRAAITIVNETGRERYTEMVRRAKEYIAAGDIFQANLSLRVSAEIGAHDPWSIYLRLRHVNPSPFAAFLDFGAYQVAGSSPERLVRVSGRRIDTRPIAGTRPRGADRAEDSRMRTELLLNEKERAEHIMLIDLERNDLGRVADYGTVQVDELMVTEQYSHVMHIVSNVRAQLAEGKDSFDAIRAAFPGGTITGVPKVRCMEIIEELEQTRRGPYTGSLGYIGFGGTMDLNIIIRTFLIRDGKAYIQAGAGIVADSDPEREFRESLKKAEALIQTLRSI